MNLKLLVKYLYWFYVGFLGYLTYQLIRIILGGSWTIEQIILGLLLANIGYTIKLSNDFSKHQGEHEGYEKGLKESNRKK